MENDIEIRECRLVDVQKSIEMVRNCILQRAPKAYIAEQIKIWAKNVTPERWNELLRKPKAVVAVCKDKIVGFTNMDKTGYLDKLFVEVDFQRKNIATWLE